MFKTCTCFVGKATAANDGCESTNFLGLILSVGFHLNVGSHLRDGGMLSYLSGQWSFHSLRRRR